MIRLDMTYATKYWLIRNQHMQKNEYSRDENVEIDVW